MANDDFVRIMRWSATEFGRDAALRYELLIEQAIVDIGQNPLRPGTTSRQASGNDLYSYHLAGSRNRVEGDRVRRPRHFLLYQALADEVLVLRILHERADLAGYLREI